MLLLVVVSCNKSEFEPAEPKKAEPTGLVAVTMKADIPMLQAYTRALGDFSDTPSIKDIRVAVFGTSGFPQAYALAEPVDASGNALSTYATQNGVTYYFKVLLPVYDGEAHVHIIANGPDSIPFVVGGEDMDEDIIMSTMRSESPVGSYWARIIMPDGIQTQLDANGIMQTDDEGNYLPSDGTAHLFENLVLVRNFAEIKLSIDSTVDNLYDVSWTVVNKPTYGSVAPMQNGFVDDYKNYTYNETTGRMENGTKIYNGFVFEDDPMDFTIPADSAINSAVSDPNFVYERPEPGSQKATCIMLKGKFKAEGHPTDSYYTYYRIDLMDEEVGGYFPIYRNYRYQVKIHMVGNRGALTPTEAMNRDSGGNVSLSTEAQKLTDISDGVSRLYVEYVEKSFTSGGKKSLWVYYVPDVTTGVVDNTKITWSIKEQGTALIEGATVTKSSVSSDTGAYVLEFELNDQDEENDLVSKLQIKASNGVEGDDKSTLYRDITLRVLKKMNMALSLVPKQVAGQGSTTLLNITLPDDLPSSMFPLEFYIEDVNHTLYSTGSDGEKSITVPVKTDKSIVDGTTNSFYFIRTVNESEYLENHTISTQFKTNKDASATTIYVANEYFKTQSINLLNDGVYVNPTHTTVPFNATSVTVEVEFAEPAGKSWTVAAGNGITSITDSLGTAFNGATGNRSFVLNFPPNNSTTAAVTRTATVTYNGTPHTVTITQSPLEFSITPGSQTVDFNVTSTTVTVNAEEGKSWTASISGPNGVPETEYSLSATSGEGPATLTVTLPKNTATSQRQFTVTATMTDPSATVTSTIIQRRGPNTFSSFAANGFGNFNNTSSATSSDGFITVDLNNCYRNRTNYFITAYYSYGTVTITPQSGIKITTVVITYSDTSHTDYNATVSTGSKDYGNNSRVLTWTVNSSDAVTYTSSSNSTSNQNSRRIESIVVNYEPL